MTTQLFIRLEHFTKSNDDFGSRCYTSEPANNNMAHIVGSYCKSQGIDYADCCMTIFKTRTAWMNDYDNWHSKCRKGYPTINPNN